MRRSIAFGLLVLFSFRPTMGQEGQEVQVATTVAFTEGPTADAAGNIFFTDQANNRIMKLATDGKLSTFRQPAKYANGLVFDPQWRLLVRPPS